MIEQVKEVVVGRPLDVVFDAIADATRWSQLTPTRHGDTRYEVVLQKDGHELVFVHAPDAPRRHVQLRTIERERRTIRVRYLVYPWPIRDFEATWTFREIAAGTRVRLHYRMGIASPLAGDWIGRHLILPRFYGRRTQATLEEMRSQLEREGIAAERPAA
jgi:hypothetical protein